MQAVQTKKQMAPDNNRSSVTKNMLYIEDLAPRL